MSGRLPRCGDALGQEADVNRFTVNLPSLKEHGQLFSAVAGFSSLWPLARGALVLRDDKLIPDDAQLHFYEACEELGQYSLENEQWHNRQQRSHCAVVTNVE